MTATDLIQTGASLVAVLFIAWLVGRMGIDDSRVKTRGLGQTRIVVPPTESVGGQMLNRRVEIVIQNNVQ